MPIQIQQVRRIEFNDEEIGMGFNSESGLTIGSALEGFTVEENLVAPGAGVFATISIVNSHEELMTSLGISANAEGRYGFFSGSFKSKFSESTNYNSTSTFLVARCLVKNSLKRGMNFRVSTPAQELLNAGRFDEFKIAFGDSFVRGLQTGGEFYCVIRITSISTSKQQELSVTLQAEFNALVNNGSFKGQFIEANSNESTKSEFSAMMYQYGGIGSQISPVVEISEAITRYKNFPQIARENPAAYETEVVTYNTLPLPVPTPEEQENLLLAFQDARAKKLLYIQAKNDLDFARKNPLFFETLPSNDILSNAINSYTKLFNAVTAHATALSRGLIRPPSLFDPSALTPPLQEPEPIQLQRVSIPEASSPNAMPDLVGELAEPLLGIAACVNMENVDHCLAFLRDELVRTPLRNHESRAIANFFFFITRNGANLRVQGNPNPAGATVRAQFPPAGVLVTPGAFITLDF